MRLSHRRRCVPPPPPPPPQMKYAHAEASTASSCTWSCVDRGDGSDDDRKFDRSVDGIIPPKDLSERAKKITGRVLEAAQEVMKTKAEQERDNGKWTRKDQQTYPHGEGQGRGKPEQRRTRRR